MLLYEWEKTLARLLFPAVLDVSRVKLIKSRSLCKLCEKL